MKNNILVLLLLLLSITSCSTDIQKIEEIQNEPKVKITPISEPIIERIDQVNNKKVMLGIDILEKENFKQLENKRVGLITNQTGANNKLKSTLDILYEAQNVNLVALFGPEHGVRGDVEGGKYVKYYNDTKTNLPVYSLYGKTRKPSKEMLKNIDILVYDIQDIGVRSYTFISTMGLAIEAASENNIEFLVLDRPNPLGGKKVEGNIVEKDFISFISQFPIPYVYGLTCGELAKLLVGENMLNTKADFQLNVIPMKGWERSMTWEDTNLEWIPTSPHIPHSYSPFFYPMTGILGELRSAISIGVGYTLPFQIVGAEWIDSEKLSLKLNDMNIPGLFFRPITYKPYYAFGIGKSLHGVQIHIEDYNKVNLTNTQFYIIDALKQIYPNKNIFQLSDKNQIAMFNNAIGTDRISKMISEKNSLANILDFLNKGTEIFIEISNKYCLYN